MESQRSFLLIGLALVSFLLWQQWQMDYGPKPVELAPVSASDNVPVSETVTTVQSDVPVASRQPGDIPSVTSGGTLVRVQTDSLEVTIDTHGGDIIETKLVDYPVEQGSTESFVMFNSEPASLYVAQSGLIGANGPDASVSGRPKYQVAQSSYKMTSDSLDVPLTLEQDGLKIIKTFTFHKGQHRIDLSYGIENQSQQTQQFQQYGQLKQTLVGPAGSMFMPTYRGAAFSTQEDRYNKLSFDDMQDENLKEVTLGGWVGMLQHYFVSAWVPPQEQSNTLYSRILGGQYAAIGYLGTPFQVAPGEKTQVSSVLYVGPKDQETLAQIANGLDLTVDYGVLWWISQPLFSLLKILHGLLGNWGLAIIFITIIVKGAMYWLTKAQYESMAKLRALQPKMAALKDRYGEDRQKMSQAMMELYRKEKVNPMGGCLPLLLQMPIFLALYWVLLESVELRHAEFYLWITDLSVKDPYFVLPVLTGASMYLLQKLQPMTIQDPMQQKIMQWMPVMMSIFFLWFPAGLVLYWLISNVITLIQAKMIYSSMEKRGLKTS